MRHKFVIWSDIGFDPNDLVDVNWTVSDFAKMLNDNSTRECPWAIATFVVDGGFMCFESIDDVRRWRQQK